MLTLRRRVGESLEIGGALVTVAAFDGSSVIISIDAPPWIPVVRAELEDGAREHFLELAREAEDCRSNR